MKAIVYHTYGPPEVLQLEDLPEPKPSANKLLVRVRAAEATKTDCELRSFKFSVNWFWLPMRLALGIFRPRFQAMGMYFSGEVVAASDNHKQFPVGSRVYGSSSFRFSAYRELVKIPANTPLALMPDNMTFEEAAAVPLGGLNALHFMRFANIKAGEQVLIAGAAGSIGAHAVQIAKSMGAVVTAVDHGRKEDYIRQFGIDHFIDYTKEDFTRASATYDVIFDMVPSSSYGGCLNSLRPGGRYLLGNPRFSSMLRSVLTNRMTDKTVRFAFAKETVSELTSLTEMIEEGSITSIVGHTFPMEQAAEAHHLVETEQRLGAVVITIDGDS